VAILIVHGIALSRLNLKLLLHRYKELSSMLVQQITAHTE